MELKKYMDDKSTEALVRLIKTNTAKVYKVKGSAIYADAAYVTHVQNQDPGYIPDIDSEGLWQYVNNTWTKITTFEEGWVYNIDNAFITDNDFVEGAGKTVDAGNNIVVCEATVLVDDPLKPIGTGNNPVMYKWDLLGSLFNMSAWQTKALVAPLTVFSSTDGTATTYLTSAALPASQSKVAGTIETYDVAIITDAAEAGDVYRAVVTTNQQDDTLEDIAWVKLGNQLTVEGALELLSKICPNTPISDVEIEALWNRV